MGEEDGAQGLTIKIAKRKPKPSPLYKSFSPKQTCHLPVIHQIQVFAMEADKLLLRL